MKIAASDVSMISRHKNEKTASVAESLTAWDNQNSTTATAQAAQDVVKLSSQFLQQAANAGTAKAQEAEEGPLEISDKDQLKIQLIENFIKQLTGKDFRILVPSKLVVHGQDGAGSTGQALLAQPDGTQPVGWGIIYNRNTTTTESEQTAFHATAYVKTVDGREINAHITIELAQSSALTESTVIRLGDAKAVDPLVLNFDAASASATLYKFTFDIDVDGKTEQISFVGPGSGLLALDQNEDGVINNGSELFGPQSGNGFDDLAYYDKDRNLWIDENDDIYDRLQIWVKDENGADKLFALAAKGIGAIYLGNVSTPFSLKNGTALDAKIQNTGIFLRENGTAGTIQHVDMMA